MDAAADYVLRKFGKEVTKELGEEGSHLLARKIETMAAKYGEKETLAAVEKVGPSVFRLVEEVGEDGAPTAIRLMGRVGDDATWIVARKRSMAIFRKYGDEAADAMLKHKEIAEGVIEQLGPSSARALNAIDGQNARRLAMMAQEGPLASIPQKAELLDTIGRHGDGAMNWVWNNKGALATAAVVAKFIQNPQQFIDGTVRVVDVGGEKIVKPAIDGVVRAVNWTLVIIAAMGLVACLWLFKHWRRQYRSSRAELPGET